MRSIWQRRKKVALMYFDEVFIKIAFFLLEFDTQMLDFQSSVTITDWLHDDYYCHKTLEGLLLAMGEAFLTCFNIMCCLCHVVVFRVHLHNNWGQATAVDLGLRKVGAQHFFCWWTRCAWCSTALLGKDAARAGEPWGWMGYSLWAIRTRVIMQPG